MSVKQLPVKHSLRDVLPPWVLGAPDEREAWTCSQCGHTEESVAAYARHLMVHCLPPASRRCLHCCKAFRSDKSLSTHDCPKMPPDKVNDQDLQASHDSSLPVTLQKDGDSLTEYLNIDAFGEPATRMLHRTKDNISHESSFTARKEGDSVNGNINLDVFCERVERPVGSASNLETCLKSESSLHSTKLPQKPGDTLNRIFCEPLELSGHTYSHETQIEVEVEGSSVNELIDLDTFCDQIEFRNKEAEKQLVDKGILVSECAVATGIRNSVKSVLLDSNDRNDSTNEIVNHIVSEENTQGEIFHLQKTGAFAPAKPTLAESVVLDLNVKDMSVHPPILDLTDEIVFPSIKMFPDSSSIDKPFPLNHSTLGMELFTTGSLVNSDNIVVAEKTCIQDGFTITDISMGSKDVNWSQIIKLQDGTIQLLPAENNDMPHSPILSAIGTSGSRLITTRNEVINDEERSSEENFGHLEVTDEDKNRLVENLLNESDEHMLNGSNVYESTSDMELLRGTESDSEPTDKNSGEKFSCEICDKKFKKSIYLYRHMKKHSGEFTCICCLTAFARKENLDSHLNLANRAGGCSIPGECPDCGRLFGTRVELSRHRAKHEKSGSRKSEKKRCLYTCDICSAIYKNSSALTLHKAVHKEKAFQCDLCSKQFYRKDLLQNHVLTHSEPQLPCFICGKKVKTKKSLHTHMMLHASTKTFHCDICNKAFSQKGNMQKHRESNHFRQSHQCDQCKMVFSRRMSLAAHKLKHARCPAYNCTECPCTFITEHRRRSHIRKEHSNLSFICIYCHMSVRYRHSLLQHLKMQHADRAAEWQRPGAINATTVCTNQEVVAPPEIETSEVEIGKAVGEMELVPTLLNDQIIDPSSQLGEQIVCLESGNSLSNVQMIQQQLIPQDLQTDTGGSTFLLVDGTLAQIGDTVDPKAMHCVYIVNSDAIVELS